MPGLIDGGNAPVQCGLRAFMRRALEWRGDPGAWQGPMPSPHRPIDPVSAEARDPGQQTQVARRAKGLTHLNWQRPSPLPHRRADPRTSRGPKPRPAPAPPSAGASPPPGRALASVGAGGDGLGGAVALGRGKRGAFPVPARRGGERSGRDQSAPIHWQRPAPDPRSTRPDVSYPCPRKTAPPARARQDWWSWGAEGRGRAAGGKHPSPPRRCERSARR